MTPLYFGTLLRVRIAITKYITIIIQAQNDTTTQYRNRLETFRTSAPSNISKSANVRGWKKVKLLLLLCKPRDTTPHATCMQFRRETVTDTLVLNGIEIVSMPTCVYWCKLLSEADPEIQESWWKN